MGPQNSSCTFYFVPPRILWWLQYFWEICGPLQQRVSIQRTATYSHCIIVKTIQEVAWEELHNISVSENIDNDYWNCDEVPGNWLFYVIMGNNLNI